MLEAPFDSIHDGDRVGIAALFEDRHVDGPLTVYSNNVGLAGLCIHCSANVANKYRGLRLADRFQRHGVDVGRAWSLAVGVKVVVEWPNFYVASRKNQLGVVDFPHHI